MDERLSAARLRMEEARLLLEAAGADIAAGHLCMAIDSVDIFACLLRVIAPPSDADANAETCLVEG